MRVIATKTGYDGTTVRNEGDVFDFDVSEDIFDDKITPKEKQPSWFVPAEKKARTEKGGESEGKDANKAADLT